MNTSTSRTTIIAITALQLLPTLTPALSYADNNHQRKAELSFSDVAIPMTLAGATLGLFGAACLCDDFFDKTAHISTLKHAAQSVHDACCHRYSTMIQIMQDAYLLPSVRHEDRHKNFRFGTSEHVLYQLAHNMGDTQIDLYSSRLKNDITQLQHYHNQVLQHIDELRYQKDSGFFSLFDAKELRTLEYCARDLIQLSLNLETLWGCLDYHHAYFALYDVENIMWKRYPNELAGLYNKQYGYDALVDYLHNVLWQKNLSSYEYNTYISQLTQDLDLLEHIRAMTPYFYRDRLEAAQELQNQLDFLYGVLLAYR